MFRTGWLLLTSSGCHYAQQKSANFKFVWPRTFKRTTFGPASFGQRSSRSQTLKVASPWNLTFVPKSMPSKARWGKAPCADISHDHLAGPGIANTRFAFGISRSTWGGCVTWGGCDCKWERVILGVTSAALWPLDSHGTRFKSSQRQIQLEIRIQENWYDRTQVYTQSVREGCRKEDK